jgi:hypothetical protein
VYNGREGKLTLSQRVEEEGRIKSLILDGLEIEAGEVFAQLQTQK